MNEITALPHLADRSPRVPIGGGGRRNQEPAGNGIFGLEFESHDGAATTPCRTRNEVVAPRRVEEKPETARRFIYSVESMAHPCNSARKVSFLPRWRRMICFIKQGVIGRIDSILPACTLWFVASQSSMAAPSAWCGRRGRDLRDEAGRIDTTYRDDPLRTTASALPHPWPH